MSGFTKSTLYVDESGVASLSDKTRIFVLTGLSIDHKYDAQMSGFFELMKRKNNVPEGKSFHAVDIYEKEGGFTPRQARELSNDLISFLKTIPLKVKVFYLNKDELRKYFKVRSSIKSTTFKLTPLGVDLREIGYEILSSNLFFWYEKVALKKKDSRGAIIAESRNNADHSLLKAFLSCKEPDRYTSISPKMYNRSNNLRNKITSIRFENKIGECAGLEITDMVSYVCYQYLNRKLGKFKNKGLVKLWKTIKLKLERGEMERASGKRLVGCLPESRVYKISNFAKVLRNP